MTGFSKQEVTKIQAVYEQELVRETGTGIVYRYKWTWRVWCVRMQRKSGVVWWTAKERQFRDAPYKCSYSSGKN